MHNHPFSGVGVALVTPFKEDFSIDWSSLEQLVCDVIDSGVDYLLAMGTTAEAVTMEEEERHEIVKTIVRINNGRLPLVVGMGGNDTKTVCKHIENAYLEGVSAILSVAPCYNRPSQKGIFEHFSKVAEISPLPVMLYNVPKRTGVNIEAETTLELAYKYSKFVGIKESSGSFSQMMKIIDRAPNNFALLSGDDALALPIISLGGKGLVSVMANAYPKQIADMVHYALNDDYKSARAINYQLMKFYGPLFKEGNPSGIKALMNILGKMQNILRLPLSPITDGLYDTLRECASL